MTQAENLPSYSEFAALMQQARGSVSPAESHGILCALLVVQAQPTAEQWLAEVLPDVVASAGQGDALARETVQQMVGLFQWTQQQLSSGSFSFELILPDDEDDLASRTEALGDWCRGFLYGLGLSGIGDIDRLPDDMPEILHDMEKISHAEDYQAQDEEEDEQAFMELVEYVRVGAMMLNEEFQNMHQLPGGNQQTH
jgi:yecA family protein